MAFLTVADLQVFVPDIEPAKAQAMIDDVSARAIRVAPCIEASADAGALASIKAILRGVVLRWNDSGSGAYQSRMESQGSFSVQETFDTRVHLQAGLFRPDEITELQGLCASATSGAFMVDVTPVWPVEP